MVNRGEIWWVDLPEPNASEPGYARPVLVLQANPFNHSRIPTVIVLALSSNMRLTEAPGNVVLTTKQTGLPKASVANVSQILTLDKRFLRDKTAEISAKTMKLIDDGIRLALDV